MSAPLSLSATSEGDLDERLPAILEAVRPLADILDARPFSGLLLALTLELSPARLPALARALADAGAPLDAVPPLDPAAPERVARLAIRFRGGDPDRRRDVPVVPG